MLPLVTRRGRGRQMRDRRPRKNRRRIRWNTLRIFRGREQSRCLDIVRRSRKVNLGQSPSKEYLRLGRKAKVESPGGACIGLRGPGTPSIP
jgi:hypothetical protein